MTIKQEIADWDGKSADDIREIYDRYGHESSFVSEIIRLTKQVPIQKGTTWLLKRHVKHTGCLESRAAKQIYPLLQELDHWETKLHILQCIPYLPIPRTHKKKVEAFLRDCLVDDAKFVRAWAYNGLYELAVQYPEYQTEAKQLFEVALQTEPASVQSRIRKLLKKGF